MMCKEFSVSKFLFFKYILACVFCLSVFNIALAQSTSEHDGRSGEAVAAGDFNGDGLLDLAIGAPGETPGSDPKSGLVSVFHGTTSGLELWKEMDQSGLGGNEDDDPLWFIFSSR